MGNEESVISKYYSETTTISIYLLTGLYILLFSVCEPVCIHQGEKQAKILVSKYVCILSLKYTHKHATSQE